MTAADLKASTDLLAVAREYVDLQKRGARWIGLCPFHSEKSPSFGVHQADQFFKCFGCGVGGDVFDFIQRIEGVDFHGALKILADRLGVKLNDHITPAERRAIAEQRLRDREDMRAARWWGISAAALAESVLEALAPWDLERARYIRLMGIVHIGGPGLLAEYRAWRETDPRMTAALVSAGMASERRRQVKAARMLVDLWRAAA